jgi:PAS domain S-box-containing protein
VNAGNKMNSLSPDGGAPSLHCDPGASADLAPVTALAARLLATPHARIRLADAGRLEDADDDDAIAFCRRALAGDGVFLVPDAACDPVFAADPAVTAGRLRFYAGTALVADDGTRLGTLSVADAAPRPAVAPADVSPLLDLARLAVAALALDASRRHEAGAVAARRLAESRLKLANDVTRAALAAPDFGAAMSQCLKLAAEHIGADCAFARGVSPRSGQLEVEAHYLAPSASDLADLPAYFRRNPVTRENSIVASTIFERRPLLIHDVRSVDAGRYPLMAVVHGLDISSLMSVALHDDGPPYSLSFLFRRPPVDMEVLAETVNALAARVRDLLARKQTEERIALLQSVVLHTSDAVVVSDVSPRFGDGPRIVYVNPAFAALTGFSPEEVIGRAPTILRGPKSEIATLERLRVAVARVETVRVEMHLYRKDDTAFWAEIDVTPVEEASGPPRHWIAVIRDRTERRAAEEAQRQSARALRRLAERQTAVIDALPAHVALLDADGGMVSLSRSWAEFARASGVADCAPGSRYFDFLERCAAPEHFERLAQGVAAVLAGREGKYSGDYTCDQDGERRWYRLLLAPMASPAAKGAVAMHLDVTMHKLAEEALRRERDFSEFLIKSTTEGILVFDRGFRITLWNPGIEAITGLAPERAMGRDAFEVLPFLAGTPGERAMRGALAGAEASFSDQRYALPETGRHGFYEAYFSPLMSREQEVLGGIGFLRETTERRRIEDALRQSQKMEAVGQLTGGIAHDFNNMLTVIAGNLELLEGKLGAEPRLLRLVSAASLAARRAEKLTQQLLTFSRRQQLRPQPVDFNQIIIGLDDLLHRTVGETIEVRTLLSSELWPALADPNQLETALLNLVLNARDAMEAGGRITLETANVEVGRGDAELAPGGYAMLAIADTGQGMSEHVLGHVFEPFFTTKEVGKGTGLGLAQVYGFISQSAGHVRVESKEGRGTTVRLYLPRAEDAALAGVIAPMREQRYRGSETVLVVEDDHGVRDFAASVLRELGYRVLEASTGDGALELLDGAVEADLLFTDVVMPGRLNGVDLARLARARQPALPVLFTSGYATRLVEKDWLAEDIEFLRKPYRSIDLAARIRALLDRSDAAAE